jgi:hypothetical protein
MFNDHQAFLACFIKINIVHPNPDLASLNNTVDIIYNSKVLHQQDWGDATRCTTLYCRFIQTWWYFG